MNNAVLSRFMLLAIPSLVLGGCVRVRRPCHGSTIATIMLSSEGAPSSTTSGTKSTTTSTTATEPVYATTQELSSEGE